MNSQLQEFARQTLKDGLAQCSEGQQKLFKRMYSYDWTKPSPFKDKADLLKDINEVVDNLPAEKLDWAMQQVSATIEKNSKKDNQNVQTESKKM